MTSCFEVICEICGEAITPRGGRVGSHLKSHGVSATEYKSAYPTSALLDTVKTNREKEVQRLKKEHPDWVLKCLECEQEFFKTLVSHIRAKHSMSAEDYRDKHGNVVLQFTGETERSIRSAFWVNKWENSYSEMKDAASLPSQTKHWIRKGFTEEEADKLVSEHQRKLALMQNSESGRLKNKAKSTGARNNMSLESLSKRHNVTIDDARKFTPMYGVFGEEHPRFGKKHTPEVLARIINTSRHVSKFETQLLDFLSAELDLEIQRSFHLDGWVVDGFLSPNIVIEAFGTYWHADPRKYASDWVNAHSKKNAQDIWERDSKKIKDLSNKYVLVIVWEDDWKKDRASVLERVKNAINQV